MNQRRGDEARHCRHDAHRDDDGRARPRRLMPEDPQNPGAVGGHRYAEADVVGPPEPARDGPCPGLDDEQKGEGGGIQGHADSETALVADRQSGPAEIEDRPTITPTPATKPVRRRRSRGSRVVQHGRNEIRQKTATNSTAVVKRIFGRMVRS